MKASIIILATILLFSCTENTIPKEEENKVKSVHNEIVKPNITDNRKTISVDSVFEINTSVNNKEDISKVEGEVLKVIPEIIIKNKLDYSKSFLKELKTIGHSKFELKNNLMLINDIDSVYFPEIPKIGKQIILTAKQDKLAIALTIKRINYTTIDYKIEMVEFEKSNHFQSGQADLSAGFFFGAESNISEKTGIGYFVTEFSELSDDNCYTYIRLGYEEETGPYLLGKIIKNCNDKIKDIKLNNFKTLMEK